MVFVLQFLWFILPSNIYVLTVCNLFYYQFFCALYPYVGSRDSSVGIASRYRLGLGIESRLGRDFPHPSRPAARLTQPPIQWVSGLSRG